MENWPENISLVLFPLEFIKIPSPGLELGPCNPQKVTAGLLLLALSPVRLKHPKPWSKPIEPKSPGRDGFSSWICSGTLNWRLLGTPGCQESEPGPITSPKIFCLSICVSAHRSLLQLLTKMDFIPFLLHSLQSSCGVQEASISLCEIPGMFGSVSLELGISS